jgi:hypothetical protein
LQRIYGVTSKTLVLTFLLLLSALPVYGAAGLVPGSPIGIKTRPEYYAFGFLYGLCAGIVNV